MLQEPIKVDRSIKAPKAKATMPCQVIFCDLSFICFLSPLSSGILDIVP